MLFVQPEQFVEHGGGECATAHNCVDRMSKRSPTPTQHEFFFPILTAFAQRQTETPRRLRFDVAHVDSESDKLAPHSSLLVAAQLEPVVCSANTSISEREKKNCCHTRCTRTNKTALCPTLPAGANFGVDRVRAKKTDQRQLSRDENEKNREANSDEMMTSLAGNARAWGRQQTHLSRSPPNEAVAAQHSTPRATVESAPSQRPRQRRRNRRSAK